jgi:iron complex transport system ATP-binding protein
MKQLHLNQLSVDDRLHALTTTFDAGHIYGVIGPNGSGKSTLLSALMGLIPYNGTVSVDEHRLTKPADRQRVIAYVPQQLVLHWPLTVEDVVRLGRAPFGFDDNGECDRALAQCGLLDKKHRAVDSLSGGEQARAHMARALATGAPVLCADEPLANLDLFYQQQLLTLFRRVADAGGLVIVSLHDVSLAARYCDRLLLLQEGRLIAAGEREQVLTSAHLEAVFNVPMHVDLTSVPPHICVR